MVAICRCGHAEKWPDTQVFCDKPYFLVTKRAFAASKEIDKPGGRRCRQKAVMVILRGFYFVLGGHCGRIDADGPCSQRASNLT